jgi:hypothetical protein
VYRLSPLPPHGAARRDDITRATSSSSLGRWLARGDLVLLHPGVVALPDRAADWFVRAEAACLWAGGPLSHLSALTATGLVGPSVDCDDSRDADAEPVVGLGAEADVPHFPRLPGSMPDGDSQ